MAQEIFNTVAQLRKRAEQLETEGFTAAQVFITAEAGLYDGLPVLVSNKPKFIILTWERDGKKRRSEGISMNLKAISEGKSYSDMFVGFTELKQSELYTKPANFTKSASVRATEYVDKVSGQSKSVCKLIELNK